jgi:Flavin-binding monooxygenase-like
LEPQPGLALLRLAQGDSGAASAAIRRAVGETSEPSKRVGLLPAYVEIMLAIGDVQEARSACRELGEISAGFQSGMLGAMAAYARGAVDLADGDVRAALVALRHARQVWQELEVSYEAARVRALLGLACRTLGDEDTAALELEAARGDFANLGAAPDLARVDSLTHRASPVHVHGLTRREHQVLRLIAAFADELHSSIMQLHSSQYRHPSQLREGAVLVVGAGNSGAEIAFEVSRTHPTYLSGKPSGQIPVRHGPAAARFWLPVVRFVGHHVLTLRTPIGRKAQPRFVSHSAPLVRVKLKDLAAAGVEQVPRTVGIEDGRPALEDGRVLDVSNLIWCTGFKEEFRWIDLPIFDENKRPLHERGVVVGEPGLYFVGLPFQYALSSDVLPGVGRDAEYIAKHIARNFTSPLSNDRALILEPTGA